MDKNSLLVYMALPFVVIASPSLVIPSEARNLAFTLRVNSAKQSRNPLDPLKLRGNRGYRLSPSFSVSKKPFVSLATSL